MEVGRNELVSKPHCLLKAGNVLTHSPVTDGLSPNKPTPFFGAQFNHQMSPVVSFLSLLGFSHRRVVHIESLSHNVKRRHFLLEE